MTDKVAVTVSFQWVERGPIALSDESVVVPELPSAPGMYKLLFTGGGKRRKSIYIGEALDLRRRARSYRKPGAMETAKRINRRITEHILSGGRVMMYTASQAVLTINGKRTELDLSRKASRLLAEQAALIAVSLEGAVHMENLP